jgi:hypothetical protein
MAGQRASSASAAAAPPSEPTLAPDEAATEPVDVGAVFEFLDEQPHVYTPRGLPPVTAVQGSVHELDWTPTDGRWQPTDKPVTHYPDDDPRSGAPVPFQLEAADGLEEAVAAGAAMREQAAQAEAALAAAEKTEEA